VCVCVCVCVESRLYWTQGSWAQKWPRAMYF